MTTCGGTDKLTNVTGKKNINRRRFFTKSVGCTVGLSLLAVPEIVTEVLAETQDKTKEEIFRELDEKVDKFLPVYRSCAITSFAALNDQFQLKAGEETMRALMPFTGGITGRGETCGAVSGALLAIGMYFEPKNQNEMEKAGSSYKHGGVFFERFSKEFESTRCREVVKHQFGSEACSVSVHAHPASSRQRARSTKQGTTLLFRRRVAMTAAINDA